MSDTEPRFTPPPDETPAAPAPSVPSGPMRPIGEPDRIKSLDVLRGLAIMGIFFVNVQFFAYPAFYGVMDERLHGGPLGEQIAWFFTKAFCEAKFISMFSLLFGAGIIMQMMRADAKGRPSAWLHLRRMVVLACFGLVHALVLWYGDILFIYAVLGTLLLLFRRMQARTLLIIAACLIVVSALLGVAGGLLNTIGMGQIEMVEPDAPLRGFEAIKAAQFQFMHPAWVEGEIIAYQQGPFSDAMLFRSITWAFVAVFTILFYGWQIFAMFLIGGALMKLGFFRPDALPMQKRLMRWGLAIGLPFEIAFATVIMLAEHKMTLGSALATPLHSVGSVALCLGYVGGITALVSAGRCGAFTTAISKVGRMALSTYLMTTLIATGVMYSWGFGRFNTFSRVELLVLVLGVYLFLIFFAGAWLSVARMGPFEWLWRTITYLRPQPLLRSQ